MKLNIIINIINKNGKKKYEFINFSLPDYMSIPKGFIINLSFDLSIKKDNIFIEFLEKKYLNDNGNIIEKINDYKIDKTFLKKSMEILDFYFYLNFFEFEYNDLSDSLKEKYNKIYNFLSIHNPSITYNFLKK